MSLRIGEVYQKPSEPTAPQRPQLPLVDGEGSVVQFHNALVSAINDPTFKVTRPLDLGLSVPRVQRLVR